jgi:ABC-type oligopeptide transport system substrate-binding subunit
LIIPPARANDREYQSTRPGFFISASSGVNYYENRLHSNQVTSAANRWAGFNRGGYSNPAVDSILDRIAGTIDPRDRIGLHRQLIQEVMGSVAVLPLYWEVAPVVLLKGVKGHPFVHSSSTWKFIEWDKE